ncbi:MAG TPA: TOBE domain-containing protein [Mycobacteriales bacterium]|nr:TOBE domain-containing protein [Mycobacteriales bacterium]
MNFIEMTATHRDGVVQLTKGDLTFPVPDRLRESVAAIAGNTITVGIRPEHLSLGEAKPGDATLRAKTDVVEYLGDEEQIHLTAADEEIIALVSSSAKVRPGDVLDLRVPIEHVHMFDDSNGLSLTSRQLVAA